jgi:hypothetical protein
MVLNVLLLVLIEKDVIALMREPVVVIVGKGLYTQI